jgi:hypothetical protein
LLTLAFFSAINLVNGLLADNFRNGALLLFAVSFESPLLSVAAVDGSCERLLPRLLDRAWNLDGRVAEEVVIFAGGSLVLLLVELFSDALLDPGTETGGLDLELTDKERDVGSPAEPLESTEEVRVRDRPGLGLEFETIFPGSWLPLLAWLEVDSEREFPSEEALTSDLPVRVFVANLLR